MTPIPHSARPVVWFIRWWVKKPNPERSNKMLVETYEQEVERHPEACEESKRLIQELGLTGQAATVTPSDQRLPYRLMNAEEYEVYGLLLGSHVRAENYNADSIPLRVLQVFAHANTLDCFESFEIWHTGTTAERDPVLVAYMRGEQYTSKRYLLARWGDVLEEFPILVSRAAKIKLSQAISACEEISVKLQARIAGLRAITAPTLNGTKVPYYSD